MNPRTERLTLAGPAGRLQVLRDQPEGVPLGVAVIAHPHPLFGGTMDNKVVQTLARAFVQAGWTALRFNFRGVERSAGCWDEGRGERDDVVAAIDALGDAVPAGVPVLLTGWSFGADMALSVHDPRVAGWCAVAPPLHFATGLDVRAGDPRPKHLVLGERDDVVPPDRTLDATSGWAATTHEVVAGASHFFVGRSAAVVEAVVGCCRSLRG